MARGKDTQQRVVEAKIAASTAREKAKGRDGISIDRDDNKRSGCAELPYPMLYVFGMWQDAMLFSNALLCSAMPRHAESCRHHACSSAYRSMGD